MAMARADRARATRGRLLATALDLFERNGYDSTTVEAIAAAAGVSHMTFFRHFPTKESVVLSDPYDPLIADVVSAQPVHLGPFERVRRGLVAAAAQLDPGEDDDMRRRIHIAAGVPALRAGMLRNNETTQEVIVDALVADDVPRLNADVAAAACLGAISSGLLCWAVSDDGQSLSALVAECLDVLAPTTGIGQS